MSGYIGLPASSGIIIGPAWIYRPLKVTIKTGNGRDPETEWARLNTAANRAHQQLQRLEEHALVNIGETEAAIFIAHQELLDDVEILRDIHKMITEQHVSAEMAVKTTFDEAATMLSALDDPYFKARSQDVQDVSAQLLRCLQEYGNQDSFVLAYPSIIVADDLTPSDTVQFEKGKILGLCMAKGGPTSHTAILARSLGIPAVVNASFDLGDLETGTLTILDGVEGTVNFDPTPHELSVAKEKSAKLENAKAEQVAATHRAAITLDGHKIEVVANIGDLEDAREAIALGAEGVGLFRTELLYLHRNELLNLKEQISIYRGVMDVMAGQPLVVRSLDIGGDKSVPYLSQKEEQNPFLGWRGIRMVRERPDILANQFEALLRAGIGADLRIMIPMVSGLDEVERARLILEDTIDQLKSEGIQYAQNVQFGIMVEVPSAALLADHLAPKVDFFSIGTNDLTQYTLAVDRTNNRVATIASPYNPSVLKLISMTIQAAHQRGKWVGLCGELAGEVVAVPLLLGMGIDELSMAPANIPSVKQAIRCWSQARCTDVAKEVLGMSGSAEVIDYLSRLQPNVF